MGLTAHQKSVGYAMAKMSLQEQHIIAKYVTKRSPKPSARKGVAPRYADIVIDAVQRLTPELQAAFVRRVYRQLRVFKKMRFAVQQKAKKVAPSRPARKKRPNPIGFEPNPRKRIGSTRLAIEPLVQVIQQKSSPALQKIPIHRLPFEPLPSGAGGVKIKEVIGYYEKAAARSGTFALGEIEWERIYKVFSLNPSEVYQGKDWHRYTVFEFPWSKHVVLECPYQGNAAYVLSGNWGDMIQHGKYVLRTQYRKNCTIIVHKGDWLSKVRAALHT